MPTYHIAIIGAGPAGLSAGARAAERDRLARRPQPTHVLLEGSPALAQTIQRYQKGKHVMAEPGYLDLRSPVRFGPGSREQVLAGWTEDIARLGVNVRYGAEVRKVSGAKGAFTIALGNGESLQAEHVVLALGLEGNPRKLGVAGEDLPRVQYQLDDPGEYRGETDPGGGRRRLGDRKRAGPRRAERRGPDQPGQGVQPGQGRQPERGGERHRRSRPDG